MSVASSQSNDRRSILVVEDSNITRNILKEELEAEGYAVLLAEDGESGLEMARDASPDIILLDLNLPEKSGIDVCKEIKQSRNTSSIPVVILTARNELKDKLSGFDAGADDYLTKPFFTKELVARLKTHLRNRSSLSSSRQLGQFYLEMLFGISSAITSPFKVDDEVEVILRQALTVVRERKGSILLYDDDAGCLEVKGSLGYESDGPAVGERFRISDKLPLVESDNGETPLGISLYEDHKNNKVFIPMVAKERLTGGIEIDLDGRERRFTANDQKILYALASQAAIFIENARLERDVRSMFLNIIVSLAGAVDAKDAYTHGHSLRVARTALIVAQQVQLPPERLEPLLMSAILHDVGKIAIPDSILKKPAKLNDAEFEIMKTHAAAGEKMLAHIPALEEVLPGIRNHHEDWDGSGYPDGLAGEDIPIFGRIILIGDAFDAMTTDRIYRRKKSVKFAMNQIEKFAGSQFDPRCAEAALEAYRSGLIDDEFPEHTPTIYELIEQLQ
jgi:response regulator RpfG family c-di-GMP phosphodiesterase